jgi:hypothetical protein
MGGTISTSSTDKMVAFFGYPETYEDDAERAVRAGLELLAEISQLRSPANQPLRVRGDRLGFSLPRASRRGGTRGVGCSITRSGVTRLSAHRRKYTQTA